MRRFAEFAGHVRARSLAWLVLVAIIGCFGWAVQPTGITSTGATLRAKAACSAETTTNPCTPWFQYWQDGSSTIRETPRVPLNLLTNGAIDFNQTVSGLTPSTLYHYQLCGYGDTNISQPGYCTGPLNRGTWYGSNTPRTQPNPGNLSLTTNFRTAGPGTKGTIDLGRVLTSADTDDNPITRDGGISVQFSSNPPQSLWMFGDTVQNQGGMIALGTAAAGPFTPGQAPMALDERPTPPALPQAGLTAPSPFFPPPLPLLRRDGRDCGTPGSYAADWLRGGAKIPGTSRLLLIYGELCIEADPLAFTLERIAFAEYDPFANVFVRVDRPFASMPLSIGLPAQQSLGSPLFSGGYLYLFAPECQGIACATKGAIYLARVGASAASWSNRANFSWWTGSGWTSTSTSAVNIIPGVKPIGDTLSVADYSAIGKKYVLIAQNGIGTAAFRVHTATSVTGPWTVALAGQPPDACTGGMVGCYAVHGHPELSTTSQLVFSWFSPDDRDDFGHLRVGAINW